MQIKWKRLSPQAVLPQKQTAGSAGYDLAACLEEPLTIPPGEMEMVPLGFAAELPQGLAGFVFSRSGLGAQGLVVAQGVGVIDSDYRGPLRVGLHNLRSGPYTVHPGDRIAQLLVVPVLCPEVEIVDRLPETERGAGGFGSTGR